MRRMLVVLIATVAALYLALCAALFAKQRSLIYFPTPAPAGNTASRMALQVPGATLVVTHRPLQGEQALIYFGGNAEDVALSLPTLEQAFPGHALYLLHYRGYGGSEGNPNEADLHQDALALFEQVHRNLRIALPQFQSRHCDLSRPAGRWSQFDFTEPGVCAYARAGPLTRCLCLSTGSADPQKGL